MITQIVTFDYSRLKGHLGTFKSDKSSFQSNYIMYMLTRTFCFLYSFIKKFQRTFRITVNRTKCACGFPLISLSADLGHSTIGSWFRDKDHYSKYYLFEIYGHLLFWNNNSFSLIRLLEILASIRPQSNKSSQSFTSSSFPQSCFNLICRCALK